MRWGRIMGASCLSLAIASGSVFAQDVDPEVTIDVMPDPADLPEVVTQDISLPDAAAEEARINSEEGRATANANRAQAAAHREEALLQAEQNRQAGLDQAAAAREQGAELGAQISEEARANRENLVRGEGLELPVPVDLPELPDRAPADLPSLPDLPDLPDAASPPVT